MNCKWAVVAGIYTLLMTSCTYSPRNTKIDNTYNARQMAVGAGDQPKDSIVTTTYDDENTLTSNNENFEAKAVGNTESPPSQKKAETVDQAESHREKSLDQMITENLMLQAEIRNRWLKKQLSKQP